MVKNRIYQTVQGLSYEEDLELGNEDYKKLVKATYISFFVKETKWEFEKEYRMFLFKHRNISTGMQKMEDFLDDKYNIDLSEAISVIYLGKEFYKKEKTMKLWKASWKLQIKER